MWDRVKSDRRFQFAVGLAVVFVLAKWLFTGSLFYAAIDMQQEPAEGNTRGGVALTALGPIVIDLVIGGLISIGLWVMNVGEWLVGRVSNATNQPDESPPATQSPTAVQPSVVVGVQGLQQAMVLDLGRAALENDSDRISTLRNQIRKPKAIAELAEACDAGDMDTAEERMKEIRSMVASGSTKAKKGGSQ